MSAIPQIAEPRGCGYNKEVTAPAHQGRWICEKLAKDSDFPTYPQPLRRLRYLTARNRKHFLRVHGGAFPPGRSRNTSEQPFFPSTLSLLVSGILPDQVRGTMIPSRSNIVAIGPQLPVRWGIARRTADTQMDMVSLYCQRVYLPCSPCSDLSNQSVQPIWHLFPQHLAPVPRYPDKVVRQTIDRVCASSRSHRHNYYGKTRSHAPLRGAHNAHHLRRSTWAPAFGGPPFLPTPTGGVSRRRIS